MGRIRDEASVVVVVLLPYFPETAHVGMLNANRFLKFFGGREPLATSMNVMEVGTIENR